MIKEYKNKYGLLELETITDFVHISYNYKSSCHDFLNIETAEKIALITNNKDIQICINGKDFNSYYIILHNTPSTAALCKINKLNYIGDIPQIEIIHEHKLNNKNIILI